jgi:hypothetical protein
MKKLAKSIVIISLLGLAYVALLAWWSPQQVMDLVHLEIPNPDAASSIRGVYGSVGIFVCVVLGYLWRQNLALTLKFLALFWLLYALARLVTWQSHGPLGEFGTTWLGIESTFGILSLLLSMHPSVKSST